MSTLDTYRVQVPWTDPATGVLSYEAQRWLRQVAVRLGGYNGLSTTDVDAGSFAAMQPAVSDGISPDLMQWSASTAGDCDLMQGLAIPDVFADVVQIDTTQPTDFFGA